MTHYPHERTTKTREHGKEAYEQSRKTFKAILIILLVVIISSIFSLVTQSDPVPVLMYSVPLTAILIFSAIVLRPDDSLKRLPTYQYELDESGIHESIVDPETEEVSQTHIPFQAIHRVLIGNFVQKHKGIRLFSASHHEYVALMVIEHDNGQYMHIFETVDEFENWLPRFLHQDFPVVQTDYDLAPAFDRLEGDDLHFYDVPGERWEADTPYPPIGEKSIRNRFKPWEVRSTYQPDVEKAKGVEKTKEADKNDKKPHTKKWENRSLVALALISFLIVGLFFPFTPVSDDGSFIKTGMMRIIMGILIILPVITVFWRPYTRWYLPVLYFFVATIVGLGIYGFETLLTDLSFPYFRVIQFFAWLTIVWWVPAFILLKVIRRIIK